MNVTFRPLHHKGTFWNGKWKKAAEPPTIREEKRKGDAFWMTGEVTLKSRYSNQMKG